MKKADVVVIGAGAGGGVAAKELAVAGENVVLLERESWVTPGWRMLGVQLSPARGRQQFDLTKGQAS